MPKTEIEKRFKIKDISTLINLLNKAYQAEVSHILDTIYNNEDKLRVRERIVDGSHKSIEMKYKTEDVLGAVVSMEKELDKIPPGYHPVNSYEKVRMEYTDVTRKAIICIDIYPWGAYLEIEADNIGVIKAISGELGYDSVEPVTLNADETYLLWIKENGLPEQWHVRFGLVEPSDF